MQIHTALSYPRPCPPLPLSPSLPPQTIPGKRAVARRGPLSPPLPLPTPTSRFPSRLDVARFTHAPTHSSPRSRAARHAYAPACLCTSQPLTRPHLNLADSCGAVCAAACRSAVAAAASPLFYPSILSHSPTAGLREFVGLWSYHRHVARISRGYDRSVCSYQHVCNVGVVETPRSCGSVDCESRPSASRIAPRTPSRIYPETRKSVYIHSLVTISLPPSSALGFSLPAETPVHEHVHKCRGLIAQARDAAPSLTPRLGWVAC